MAENSQIQWCDHTHNEWIGCTKVSEACSDCYAANSRTVKILNSTQGLEWGAGKPRYLTSESNRKKPLTWNRSAVKNNTRYRVFCSSLSDWLDDEIDPSWLAGLLIRVFQCRQLDWMMLTKRPKNWRSRMEAAYDALMQGKAAPPFDDFSLAGTINVLHAWLQGHPPHNVWFGITTESQTQANHRIPAAAEIPAAIRFLSAEPLYGAIRLNESIPSEELNKFHLCIIGGESKQTKKTAQPFRLEEARTLMSQCREYGLKIFFKQFGSNPVGLPEGYELSGKGGDFEQFPDEFKIRELPR